LNEAGNDVKLGDLTVLAAIDGNQENIEKGVLSASTYRQYQQFEKVGIIAIDNDKQFEDHMSGKAFSWKLFNEQAQQSVRNKIKVRATPRGYALAKDGGLPQRDGWLKIKEGVIRIQRIVKNEPRTSGVDDYRVIMATFTEQWFPEVRRVVELATGHAPGDARKVTVLLKFDPFASQWRGIAAEFADINDDFTTHNVPGALQKLR
jgi:hypothetical protein